MYRETNQLLDVGRERTLRTLKHCLERAAALTSAPLSAADSATPSAEVRDIILVLDHGPLHLRVHVAVGGLSPQDARRASLDRLVKSLDADGDGKLSQKEAERSPLFREKQRPKAEAFLKDIGVSTAFSRKDMEQRFERLGGETVVYRQNASSSESDNSVFKLLDANKDGVVDATEMQDSVDLLLAKDGDDDECVTLDEFAPPPTTNADQIAVAMNQPRPQTADRDRGRGRGRLAPRHEPNAATGSVASEVRQGPQPQALGGGTRLVEGADRDVRHRQGRAAQSEGTGRAEEFAD